ncbi:MAG TPA: PA0069 family radical SAM protein [Candidatus Dormibacteraeota bacterium]|nr:PA0069 family radical SAM protein [Candidatus Dormibacteraeota bacterium]
MSSSELDGRGTRLNPANRYERLHLDAAVADDDGVPEATPVPTELYRDASRSILAENDSPDVGFRFSLNPYRGCEHGCVYCYARPSHEYLGFSAGLDFERKLMVKMDAPELLRAALAAPRWQPQVVALSGNTDCYQPVERQLRLTRACLEVFAEFRNPVSVITKSALVTRDADLLAALAADGAAQVSVTITTLDPELARRMEPRAATPARRLQAIAALAAAGVPVNVMVAPVIPGLNDHEIPTVLERAAEAGARSAAWVMLRLATPLDQLFTDWLERHYPDRVVRVLGRLRSCRGGALNDPRFGRRMRGEGQYAAQLRDLFTLAARRRGLDRSLPPLRSDAFRVPPRAGDQLRLL